MTMITTIASHDKTIPLTRPAGIGLPGDLLAWIEDEARQEGIPKSRFVTQVLEMERKRRKSLATDGKSDLIDQILDLVRRLRP